ncbi:GlxA family transcriptional regulator [Haloglycomyces albus]|uniref:GlxA family transcriptional regulator n=1 Tax=Haloglycomyces albus TaxID=526067 RepID=UPI00046D1533|nr:helix-turn-helix domain-containing protein [Haloglycomyces albus]
MSASVVAVLALDGVVPFDLGIAPRVFSAANHPGDVPRYRTEVCTIGGRPVNTECGLEIGPQRDESLISEADIVVVPTVHTSADPYDPPTTVPGVADVLATMRSNARLVSFCSAAFLLAELGYLEGRSATTHWLLSDRLRNIGVDVVEDVLYVDEGSVLTSAGAAAAIDLCLHMVRQDYGSEVANVAARKCVVAPWRDGGQAQFIERPVPSSQVTSTSEVRAWLGDNLHRRMSIDVMAHRACMSRRTLTRRFRAETGLSPTEWLKEQRIERARTWLETTDIGIDRVATQVGFGSGTVLRRHFRDRFGLSPSQYRRRFSVRDDDVSAASIGSN